MLTDEKKTCTHPACSCEVEGGGDYCSDYCQNPDSIDYDQPLERGSHEICSCAHTECSGTDAAKTARLSQERLQWDA